MFTYIFKDLQFFVFGYNLKLLSYLVTFTIFSKVTWLLGYLWGVTQKFQEGASLSPGK